MNGHIIKTKVIYKEGKPITAEFYSDDKLCKIRDFSKAPNIVQSTIYKGSPDNEIGIDYILLRVKNDTGATKYLKKLSSKEIFGELILDDNNQIIKSYVWENGKRVYTISDKIEVVGVETGFIWPSSRYTSAYPAVKLKLKNISGEQLEKSVRVNYKFLKNDEIIYSSSKFFEAKGGWDNNFIITEVLSEYGYNYSRPVNGIKVVISFDDDGTTIYDGTIKAREVIW